MLPTTCVPSSRQYLCSLPFVWDPHIGSQKVAYKFWRLCMRAAWHHLEECKAYPYGSVGVCVGQRECRISPKVYECRLEILNVIHAYLWICTYLNNYIYMYIHMCAVPILRLPRYRCSTGMLSYTTRSQKRRVKSIGLSHAHAYRVCLIRSPKVA